VSQVDAADVLLFMRRREMALYELWLLERDDHHYNLWLKALHAWLDERAARGAVRP
jgi:hypothetical protein